MKETENIRERCSQRDYTLGFKLQVISEVEKWDYTYKQAQKHYDIQGRSTVLVWLQKYGNLDWSKPILRQAMKSKDESPVQKIKRLERELSDEKLKNRVLNAMIDLSDRSCGTQIRKKYSSQ